MFAKAFQLKGLRPVVVTLPDARNTRRLHELFGIDGFVTLDEYLTPELENEARRIAAELHASVTSPGDLKELRYEGADVGRESLSTVSRYLHEGGVDLDDPRARELLAQLLRSAVRTAMASKRMLDDLQPRLLAVQRAELRRRGPALRHRAPARARRDPVRRRLRGRHDRLQALHGRDEGDPPALARGRVVAARAGDAVDAGARRRARRGVHAPLRQGRDVPRALEPGLDARGRRARRSSRSSTSTRQARRRSSSRTSSGTRTCSSAATSSPTRRSGSSRPCARRARTTASTGSSSSIRRTSGSAARRRLGRARRARRDPRADRRAAAARDAARAGHRHLDVVALRRHRRRRHDPRLGRLRAAVLRRSRR